MDEVSKVILYSRNLGKCCTAWHAKEALRPGRGYGIAEQAITWLFTDDGFQALENQKLRHKEDTTESRTSMDAKKSSIVEDITDARKMGLVANEVMDSSDKVSVGGKENVLKNQFIQFAVENGIHENVARNAALRFSSFNEGCQWMLCNTSETEWTSSCNDKSETDGSKGCDVDVECLDSGIAKYGVGNWACSKCTYLNAEDVDFCVICENFSSFRLKLNERDEELSKLKIEAMAAEEKFATQETERLAEVKRLNQVAQGLEPPGYWDEFPAGEKKIEVELINATAETAKAERDRMIKIFIDGGIGITSSNIISLKRIQDLHLWQRYAAQKALIANRPSNKGNPNIRYLFHGPRTNTDAIVRDGFIAQFANSNPYGIWTHVSSQYSGGTFADTNPPGGGRRIFICQAAVGTLGRDDGSGRRPMKGGVLADCHESGGVHIFYQDSQLYPEYLIQWK